MAEAWWNDTLIARSDAIVRFARTAAQNEGGLRTYLD